MIFGTPNDLTWYKFLTDWGSLIGGVFALIAGIIAYLGARYAAEMQRKIERQKYDQETETVRKSLAIELRQMVTRSLGVHDALKGLATQLNGPITVRIFQSAISVPTPVVYPAIADRIGLLHGEAMDIVIVYQLIEIGRNAASQLMQHPKPDNLPPRNVASIATPFLQACIYARGILPKLRTGVVSHDEKDDELIKVISKTECDWGIILKQLQ